ncbi:hypothetical protein F8568_038075 [Actinomadura sp. LD22]|uniref:Uncharacterized protein n=1 Tax=Actinomadura physcomitrii TaxID=2650748 RepID=A0A6I4MRR8_9ACTN|nr:hypothetical protein [Actinomadura physcomitrii]MWA06061.1 hypothetical protein [Actinomadura physcomitrii]
MDEVESYRDMAGLAVGGFPLLIALVGSGLPAWRRGFYTTYRKRRGGLAPYRAILLALLAGALLTSWFAYDLHRSEGVSLFAGDFWGGLREGTVIVGVVPSGIVGIVLVAVRALIMKSRGAVAYNARPYLSFGRLERMWRAEQAALTGELADSGPSSPAGAQARACLDVATRLYETKRAEHGDPLGAGHVLAAIVLARAGRTALNSGAPIPEELRFCALNPLHGVTADTYPLFLKRTEPASLRPLCASCRDRSMVDPDFDPWDRTLQLPGSFPQLYSGYEPFVGLDHGDGIGVDALLRGSEERLDLCARTRR